MTNCGNPTSSSTTETPSSDEQSEAGLETPIQLSTNLVVTSPDNATADALPFTLEFTEQIYSGKPAFPSLQSYVASTSAAGEILVVGGRIQGLHTFGSAPADNFPKDSSNHNMFVINPTNGDSWSFDVNNLADEYSAPLQSTNLQGFHDQGTDIMYVVGGYGWKADKSDMLTFNTIISFKLEEMVSAIKAGSPASTISTLLSIGTNDIFAVTGGELFKMGREFYLVFGQKFTGQYRAFGGSDYEQEYTEQVRVFTLKPNTLEVLSAGPLASSDADQPFHRRDGNIVEDIDPATGTPRISAFGGVFQPGIIGPYTYPVYINSPSQYKIDRSGNQKFSQYECPVISVYQSDPSNSTTYHNFFGGIGHYYYHQTESQKSAYNTVTAQGRNDGFPYVCDITTFQQSADGTYKEFIHLNPITGNRLLGTSIRFIPNKQLIAKDMAFSNGVIKLNNIPAGTRELVGFIYGGIEASEPLPLVPNSGTHASNSVFAVYLTNTPSAAIPATEGNEGLVSDANDNRGD